MMPSPLTRRDTGGTPVRGLRRVSTAMPMRRTSTAVPMRRISNVMPGLHRKTSNTSASNGHVIRRESGGSEHRVPGPRHRSSASLHSAGAAVLFLSSRRHSTHKNLAEMKEEEPQETAEEKKCRIRRKLRVLFWTAKMVGGVAMHMRNDSIRLTEQGGLELYYGTISQEEEEKKNEPPGGAKGLKFDKTLFSRAKGSALPLPARIIAGKLPKFRTEPDLQVLYRVMNSMRSFKEKLTQEMKWNVCKSAGYLSCNRGRIVFRQGHDGTDFYFIYSGSVMIQVSRQDKSGDTHTSVENVIESGNSFGELGLLSDDGIRTATVICREQTELFQIDKESFLENFSELFRIELNLKLSLARDIALFSNWTEERLRALCFKSVLLTQPYGKLIDKDWSATNQVVFVIKGKVLLLRAIEVSSSPQMSETFIIDNFGRALPCHSPRARAMSSPGTRSKSSSLPRSRSRLASSTSTCSSSSSSSSSCQQRFMAVGMIFPGQSSDLRVLSKRLDGSMDPIILVSQGCEYLRFQKQDIEEFVPNRMSMENYLREDFKPMDLASLCTLQQHYYEDTMWKQYRNQVCEISHGESIGSPLAMRPATAKGSTGWGRWPGIRVNDLKTRACTLHPDGWSCCCPPVDSKHKSVVFQ